MHSWNLHGTWMHINPNCQVFTLASDPFFLYLFPFVFIWNFMKFILIINLTVPAVWVSWLLPAGYFLDLHQLPVPNLLSRSSSAGLDWRNDWAVLGHLEPPEPEPVEPQVSAEVPCSTAQAELPVLACELPLHGSRIAAQPIFFASNQLWACARPCRW